MLTITKAIYRMTDSNKDTSLNEYTPEEHVEKVFKLLDKDNDGKLTREEFQEGVRQNPSILQTPKIYKNIL
jgi:Ca2+-binding EF-hand superfamily protein